MLKKINLIISVIVLTFSLSFLFSCKNKGTEEDTLVVTFNIEHNPKFGGIDVCVSIEDFVNLGFSYGDSIDCVLTSGGQRLDIPFYNGYYSRMGDPLLCAYPGYEKLHLANNNGSDLFVDMNAKDDDKVTITLKEKGKYKVQQDVMDTVYSNERSEFDSDAMFANYRALVGGSIKENRVYRGVSPVNNCYNRAIYLNGLIKNDGIKFVLNLSDSEKDIENYNTIPEYKYSESYFKELYDGGNAVLLSLGSNFSSNAFKTSLGNGLKEMLNHDGPYYIHCTEGKDRTGFVCLLLEALCGATYEEIKDDYMITYYNYYRISKTNQTEKYDAIVNLKLYDMVYYLTGEADTSKFDSISYSSYAIKYIQDCGLSDVEVNKLIEILTK